jgi:hypothetical protein
MARSNPFLQRKIGLFSDSEACHKNVILITANRAKSRTKREREGESELAWESIPRAKLQARVPVSSELLKHRRDGRMEINVPNPLVGF